MSREALPPGTVVVDRVWKRFRADRTRRLLRDHAVRLAAQVRERRRRRYRWALQDVSFELAPGESVGLVGRNGSGKSTLLKILTGVMFPHAGRVRLAGRVGALLEVRAGLHPDLTGRENILLYGSLLGLTRAEVVRRFDEIVDFAELAGAVDRQVKFYSSGMQMRLGFSVAAFLEPDVLLVDEALAVGDAFFQQRCLERMRTLIQGGTTLVLVSHDLAQVEAVCARCLWLHDGRLRHDGPVRETLSAYRRWIEENVQRSAGEPAVVEVAKAEAAGDGGPVKSQGPLTLRLVLRSPRAGRATLCVGLTEGTASPVVLARTDLELCEGDTEAVATLPFLPLPRGGYYLWATVLGASGEQLLPWRPAMYFEVFGSDLTPAPRGILRLAPVQVDAAWEWGWLDG
jgi:ABC-type polysaccharide/polyol phosphate transport system ATPase subunit